MEEDTGKGSVKVLQDKDQSHYESSVDEIMNMMSSISYLSTRVQAIWEEWEDFKEDHTYEVPLEDYPIEDRPLLPKKFDLAGFRDWVEKIEMYFLKHDVPEYKKVALIASTLEGDIIQWWEEVEEVNKKVDKKDEPFTWDDMKLLLMVHFFL